MTKKIIATTIDNGIMVFESEEQLNEHNNKIMLEVLNNGFTTTGYSGKEGAMNRLESIKGNNEKRKRLMNERKNEYSMTRELEYQGLVNKSVEDIEYLLQRLERYEKALNDITTEIAYTTITPSEKVQEIEYIVEEALKE